MSELIPLNKSEHKNLKIQAKSDFQFAAQDNLCPIVLLELTNVLKQAPIVFLKGENGILSIFMLQSFYPNSNFFVDGKGGWKTNYIPCFYRIKPFSLANSATQDQKVLCYEKDSPLISSNPTTKGNKLFNEDGQPSEYLQKLIEFVKEYEQSRLTTQKALVNIEELDIIEEFDLQIKVNEENRKIKGLWRVDVEKFKNLKKDTFFELKESNALYIVYAHFFSMTTLVDLANLNLKEKQPVSSSEDSLKDRAVKKQKAEDKKQLDNLVKNLLIEDE